MTIFLFLVCLVCLIAGLIKPNKMIFWRPKEYRTRKNVLKYFGTATIVFLILVGVFNPSSSTKTNTTVASNNKTETVQKDEPKQEDKKEVEQPKEVKKLGWTQEKGNWYYYDNNGKPKTGWIKDNNKSYYFNSSGIMQKGWINDQGKDYYIDNSGVMQTGWKESNGKWYYLNSDGSMASNTTVNGYYLATNGAMQEQNVNSSNSTSSSDSNSSTKKGSTSNSGGITTNEPAQGNRTVYWVAGGKSYHYDRNCRTLARSKNVQEGPASSCPKKDPCDICAK